MISKKLDADHFLALLKQLVRDGQKLKPEGGYQTCGASLLKELFLATGGVTTIRRIGHGAAKFDIKHRHLGVGVYNVWLKRTTI